MSGNRVPWIRFFHLFFQKCLLDYVLHTEDAEESEDYQLFKTWMDNMEKLQNEPHGRYLTYGCNLPFVHKNLYAFMNFKNSIMRIELLNIIDIKSGYDITVLRGVVSQVFSCHFLSGYILMLPCNSPFRSCPSSSFYHTPTKEKLGTHMYESY